MITEAYMNILFLVVPTCHVHVHHHDSTRRPTQLTSWNDHRSSDQSCQFTHKMWELKKSATSEMHIVSTHLYTTTQIRFPRHYQFVTHYLPQFIFIAPSFHGLRCKI